MCRNETTRVRMEKSDGNLTPEHFDGTCGQCFIVSNKCSSGLPKTNMKIMLPHCVTPKSFVFFWWHIVILTLKIVEQIVSVFETHKSVCIVLPCFRHNNGEKHADGPMLSQTERLLPWETRTGVSGKPMLPTQESFSKIRGFAYQIYPSAKEYLLTRYSI